MKMNVKKLMTTALAFTVTASAYLALATGTLILIRGGQPPAAPVEHDYSGDYLTFRTLTPGTICWKAFGSLTKTIEYKVNNGEWTSITSTSDGATISVEEGDLIRFRGTNTVYATSKSAYSGFEGGTATYDIEGNIMSLLYGDNFSGNTDLPNSEYIFCSVFKKAPVISAEHLILPATTLKNYCYRALFSYCTTLTKAPELPATTLATGCYWYMFEQCAITEAPALNAAALVNECYGYMFTDCGSLARITCLATSGFGASRCLEGWVTNVADDGTFTKSSDATNWTRGNSGIPSGWTVRNDIPLLPPEVSFDGETIELVCPTEGADIYYKIGQASSFTKYTAPIEINSTVTVQAYSTIEGKTSETVSRTCTYIPVALAAPSIFCANNLVTIACTTPRSAIHYRLGGQGEFSLYGQPIEIEADTVVEAYSTYKGQTSTTVSTTCEYVQIHDYSADYLTFRVLTPGTISWKAVGGLTKTIEYSIDNGAWTSITSTAEGATISVAQGNLVRFRGNNTAYATSKSVYSGFGGETAPASGSATYDIEGNIMSLLYGDNFVGQTTLPDSDYIFCSLFKKAPVISAEHLILPATTLKNYCYRALFSKCTTLTKAPELPATTLATGCYWYMFEECIITEAPVLNATTLVNECYGHMFEGCGLLSTITCLATDGFGATNCRADWVKNVAGSGTFVKAASVSWTTGNSGIPTGWNVCEDVLLLPPEVSFDGETIELECGTAGAEIHYRLGQTGDFVLYTQPIPIVEDTVVEAYSTYQNHTSETVTQTCVYVQETPFQKSNKDLPTWRYGGNTITTPYSVNRIDGHTSSYAKGTFAFDTSISLRAVQPTYLWFQHADQSADIYVNNVKVETHWGGYNAFFSDISEYVRRGKNDIRVALCNTTRNTLAPAAGDFNFNATLGNVKLFTSPVLPAMKYGYDGFHITSTVSASSATTNATINVETEVPAGASLTCIISDDRYAWTNTVASTGMEQTFTTTISNPRLWNGTIDPHLYTVTLEIRKDGDLYHRYERPYGFRYYEYVIDEPVNGENYTGFLLNGRPYLLRGVCMHDDVEGKANALTDSDYDQEFAIIQELGCNFIRLAHYPHPMEVYDRCDRLGIIVQTEVPCVNKLQSTMPSDYYTHLETQYRDMVEQHFNHPCIMFWGLSNETTTDDKAFGKEKIEGYYDLIKDLDSERLIGYVVAMGINNPSGYYNDPKADWFGCNIYFGWYGVNGTPTNDPSGQLNTRIKNTLTNRGKPLALSEYGCGGTQHCHSEDFISTTTTGNNPRHDIEYQMWLHEGYLAAIRNYTNLLFTSQWQLFDIAVSSRNEGFTECIDGTTVTTNDVLRRLNNKGLVERDHRTKKDTFYLYKAEWSSQKFVHICGKDYTKTTGRKLKCYTNDGNTLSMYVGDSQTPLKTATVVDHIAEFTETDFPPGVEIRVEGDNTSDTVTFQ